MPLSSSESLPWPPFLFLLVRDDSGFNLTKASWGDFDCVHVRTLQDLFFPEGLTRRIICAFTLEPPSASGVLVVPIPFQLALESVFFHVAQVDGLILNPRFNEYLQLSNELPVAQRGVEFTIPNDFEPSRQLIRSDLPQVIGSLAALDTVRKLGGGRRLGEADLARHFLLAAAEAFQSGDHFKCCYLAKEVREAKSGEIAVEDTRRAWFYELMSLSFFGSAEEALSLYEQYPDRGSPDPHSQLLAARYRLLLKQFNESRTILHTLSFNSDLGAIASSELARTFLIEKHYLRALDSVNAALKRDPDFIDAYLLRGIALRGVAYESGDVDGLKEAYADFERVAKHGGYGAAEALYHAGTVSARLGVLAGAETAFRQSLFQRDRISARDALIRILTARGDRVGALFELEALNRLAPASGARLQEELSTALTQTGEVSNKQQTKVRECSELWSDKISECVVAARALLGVWGVPFKSELNDGRALDDFINRFAPDGDFPKEGRFSALSLVGHDIVARAFALHLGEILVASGEVSWGADHTKELSIISDTSDNGIPVEGFVYDRILLGASGDNFTSLESLVLEFLLVYPPAAQLQPEEWWSPLSTERLSWMESEVAWTAQTLTVCGVSLTDGLADLEELDRWIETAFEPAGGINDLALKGALFSNSEQEDLAAALDRFIIGLGLLVGQRISGVVSSKWYDHEKPEGLSVFNSDLGQIFPVAKLQRRVYLGALADFSLRLTSLAWSVAVAGVAGEVKNGHLMGEEAVRGALLAKLPSIASFPESELSGVVSSLLIGGTIVGVKP